MKLNPIAPFFAAAAVVLSSCQSNINQVHGSVTQFAQAAHAASHAEMEYLKAAQEIDVNTQRYDSALDYTLGKTNNFNVYSGFKPRNINANELATRKALLDAIGLYGEKMEALSGDGDDVALDTHSTAVARKLCGLEGSVHLTLTGSQTNIANGVVAAIETIAKFALNEKRAGELRNAAAEIQPELETVVTALKQENVLLERGIGGNLSTIEQDLKIIVAKTKQSDTPNKERGDVFFDLLAAQSILAKESSSVTSPTPDENDPNKIEYAKPINETLDAIVTANAAIAHRGRPGMVAEARYISAKATDAAAFYKSISHSQ